MVLSFPFVFPLPNGLHARPASHLADLAKQFSSAITLHPAARDVTADVKSVLSMVGADIRLNESCVLRFEGDDAVAAREALESFVVTHLPHIDEALPELPVQANAVDIPKSLASAGLAQFVRGMPVSRGVAIGVGMRVHGASLPESIAKETPGKLADEQGRFQRAVEMLSSRLTASAATASENESEVMSAHASLLRDPELHSAVHAILAKGEHGAASAVLQAGRRFIAMFERSDSAYLRERVLDLQDVILQLLEALGVPRDTNERITLTSPTICVADHLTPGQFLSMDANLLKGLVLAHGGTTSHTVILARARGIPMLVDVGSELSRIPVGSSLVIDAEIGLIAPISGPASGTGVSRYYDLETQRIAVMRQRNAESQSLPAQPIGGEALEVGANISSADEVARVMTQGADGIGLFRTEMLFMSRSVAPSEQEQYESYARTLTDAGGKPVIIRTFDIGGDKPAPYLKLPHEANPFLGNRGVRLYATQSVLIREQLRALLRASRHGRLKILVPMIAAVEEVRAFRALLGRVRDELMAEGVSDVVMPSLGVMIEIPAAAMIIPQLSKEVDFFSIGSNDLTQYLLAADRDNPQVAELYSPLHPSLWKMLATICREAKQAGRWVGLCGELGENTDLLPLLVGIGLDEISLSGTKIAEIKRRVRSLDRAACADVVAAVTVAETRDDVRGLLREFGSAATGGSMLEEDLVKLDSTASTKAEAIKELTDRLWLADRVGDNRVIERAIWTREASYATGFGYGCAIPHCKSPDVKRSSIAVSKLSRPVAWNEDEANPDQVNPVDLIIMLVLREQDHGKDHMRVLAQLSRMLMRDEFRDSIRQSDDAAQLTAFLKQSLNLQ